MHKIDQKGIGATEVIILIVVVALIGAAGIFAYSRSHNKKVIDTGPKVQPLVVLEKQHTDTSKTFSFDYPDGWSVKKYNQTDGQAQEPDWTKTPQPITLTKDGADSGISIKITGENPATTTVDQEFKNRKQDKSNIYAKLKINGYDALYHMLNFVSPDKAETYTDHEYLIVNGKKSIKIEFREKYSNKTNKGESDFDATKERTDFELVSYSIKFL